MANRLYGSKILVVDDEKLIRLTISAKLRQAGYDCTAVADVGSAVEAIKAAPKSFVAIVTDIMMAGMDGFVFRDIVRGIERSIPMFFLTALDPEEGSGFLKRILEDPQSYYLPKSVKTDVLINRVRRIVASRRIETFIERKMDEDHRSMELAAHIQRSLLPIGALRTPRGFYTMYWRPFDMVSGDLFDAIPFGAGCYLYVVGDIQGHGTSAALAMTAVQSFLKNLTRFEGAPIVGPETIANMLHKFFRANLADVSYMTANICVHRPLLGSVKWISCGAPDILVIEDGVNVTVNPEHRGGVPIGMFEDTVYSAADVVDTPLTRKSLCIAYTDGLLDLSQDVDGDDRLPLQLSRELRCGIAEAARREGTCMAGVAKFIKALAEFGYDKFHDDVTVLMFGATVELPGIYEATLRLLPSDIDAASQKVAEWCREQGWPDEGIARVQLVLEEKLMNIHDHGFNDRDRLREVVSIRLTRIRDKAVLTVWDSGTEEPSIAVATGDAEVALEKANQDMKGRGRGRLIVRELCDGIERNRYPPLNETTYHIPLFGKDAQEQDNNGGLAK